MSNSKKISYLIPLFLVFVVVPLVYLILGNFSERSLLKDIISFVTIIAFFMMVAQFFLVRSNKVMLTGYKMGKIIKGHKVIGYIFITILFVHPFFIVVPRFFESGVDPLDAFKTIITTYEVKGLLLGVIAWFLMILLGLTSLFRSRLPMKYTTWRVFHGILSILFILLASLHVIGLGRHSDKMVTFYIVFLVIGGLFLLLNLYLNKSKKTGKVYE